MHRGNSRGFSLIELLVTIAILGIAVSLVVGSFSLVYIQNMKGCASEIDALLSKTKICAMSRAGDVYLVLRADDDGVWAEYHEGAAAVQTDKVGKSTVGVTWIDSLGAEHALSELPLALSFSRGTGAFTTLAKSFGMAGFGGCPAGEGLTCTKIVLSGGGVTRAIELIPQTGKHSITAG